MDKFGNLKPQITYDINPRKPKKTPHAFIECRFCTENRSPTEEELNSTIEVLKTVLKIPELSKDKLTRASNASGDTIFSICIKIAEKFDYFVFQVLLHIESIRYLLFQKNRNGVNSWLQVCSGRDCNLLQIFLSHGASEEDCFHNLWTPQNLSAKRGCVGCLKSLTDVGYNMEEERSEWNPLNFTTKNCHNEATDYLVDEMEVDVNFVGKEGWTALFFCAVTNQVTSALKILNKGAYKDVTLNDGSNILSTAVVSGSWMICKLLLEVDSNFYKKTLLGATQLKNAISVAKHQIDKYNGDDPGKFYKCLEVLLEEKKESGTKERVSRFNMLLCAYVEGCDLSVLPMEAFKKVLEECLLFDVSSKRVKQEERVF